MHKRAGGGAFREALGGDETERLQRFQSHFRDKKVVRRHQTLRMQVFTKEQRNYNNPDKEGEQKLGPDSVQRGKGMFLSIQFGKEKKDDPKEDPSAGIMNMMKKMYEEGD